MRLTCSPDAGASAAPTAKAMLNQGASGVTHGVCEASARGGASVAGRVAAPGAPTSAVPRRVAAATASVQRAVVAQRVDTGRG